MGFEGISGSFVTRFRGGSAAFSAFGGFQIRYVGFEGLLGGFRSHFRKYQRNFRRLRSEGLRCVTWVRGVLGDFKRFSGNFREFP